MTDWREAGRKADARRVLNVYRGSFEGQGKRIARSRVIDALRAAGCSTVVTLWGGGLCAEQLVTAGFRVIAVDNGSMSITDHDREVSQDRKRRAMELAAQEGGYECRWGDVSRFLHEGDGAFLDFHGPWQRAARRAVGSARHMKAVAVTLMPDHDTSTDASSALERQMAYQVFLKMAWASRPRWHAIVAEGHVRRLTDYHADRRQLVSVYLLAHEHIVIGSTLTINERAAMRLDVSERLRKKGRDWYHRNSAEVLARQRSRRASARLSQTCAECLLPFAAERRKKICSPGCRASRKTARQRERRVAAVSGTAAKPSNELEKAA